MKRTGFVSMVVLFLLTLTPRLVTAQSAARGTYRFWLEDELTKSVEFDAQTDERGTATGSMTLIDDASIPFVDDPEDPRAGDAPPQFYMKAELDGMTVDKNRAVMSGMVRDSSIPSYIGRWVQLVVEDNGENTRVPDRLTWAICRPQERGWIPSDAELKDDDGAFLRWWATDAERKDDVGIPSPNLLPGEEQGCQVYPLSVYSFVVPQKWEGDLIVIP
jgi:hypothetical protein